MYCTVLYCCVVLCYVMLCYVMLCMYVCIYIYSGCGGGRGLGVGGVGGVRGVTPHTIWGGGGP